MKQEVSKLVTLCCWKNCQQNQWPLAQVIDVDIDRNGDMCSVMLCVADLNNGNKTFRQLITKIVLLIKNKIDSPTKEAIRMSQYETLASWEELDKVAWYEIIIIWFSGTVSCTLWCYNIHSLAQFKHTTFVLWFFCFLNDLYFLLCNW